MWGRFSGTAGLPQRTKASDGVRKWGSWWCFATFARLSLTAAKHPLDFPEEEENEEEEKEGDDKEEVEEEEEEEEFGLL